MECCYTRNSKPKRVDLIGTENTRAVSFVGPNETQAALYTNMDDTINSIFVPNIGEAIERNGKLTQWTASFMSDVIEVYFQVRVLVAHHEHSCCHS